jgi:hypothetical protein
MVFQRVPQMEPRVESVMILAPHALPLEVAPPFEIDHYPLYGPFCNQHHHRNVSNADVGPEKDAMEDMGMVAQKRPVRVLKLIRHVGHFSGSPRSPVRWPCPQLVLSGIRLHENRFTILYCVMPGIKQRWEPGRLQHRLPDRAADEINCTSFVLCVCRH